ncbi:MAG: hypothetical protein JSV22_06580, partial [Bacteroidales bacterium]
QEQLDNLRIIADEIVINIWNEVEKHYKNEPEDLRREKAKKYGLVYVFRRNELANAKSPEDLSARSS